MNPYPKRSVSRWRIDDSILEKDRWEQDKDSFDGDSTPLKHPPAVPANKRLPSDGIVFLSSPPICDEPLGDVQEDDCDAFRGISCAPCPPVDASVDSKHEISAPHDPSAEAALPDLSIRPGQPIDRQISAGWLGSVALHLLFLVLIALMVAPADFSGVGTQIIELSLHDLDAPMAVSMTLLENADVQDTSTEELEPEIIEVEIKPQMIEPTAIALHSPRTNVNSGVASQSPGNSNGRTSGGSQGSFFGIHADGHDFVYVLDRSNSMASGRYDRATEECLRSVRGLREDQSFFVVLFSNQDRLMFNSQPSEAGPVPATQENKQRLAKWLDEIDTGGGTDPTSALRLAIGMQPSAIFMLSDGEFQKPKQKRSLFAGGGDALSIVKASAATIPIHTIAFEDPKSCLNLQQIAELTTGQYRFVKSCDRTEKELLAEAKKLLVETSEVIDPRRLKDLFEELAASNLSDDGRQSIASWVVNNQQDDLLYSTFDEGLLVNDEANENAILRNAVDRLNLLALIDPNDEGSEIQIQHLVEKVRRGIQLVDDANVSRLALNRIAAFPGGWTTRRIVDSLADPILELDQTDVGKMYIRCSDLVDRHPGSQLGDRALAEMRRIRDSIVGIPRMRVANGNLSAAIRSLRGSLESSPPTVLAKIAESELESLTLKTLLEIRGPGADSDRKKDLKRQLELGYEGDSRLAELKRQSNQQELAARRIAKRVDLDKRNVAVDSDRPTLDLLIKRFPYTVMATKARVMLKDLNRRRDSSGDSEKVDRDLDRLMSGETSP